MTRDPTNISWCLFCIIIKLHIVVSNDLFRNYITSYPEIYSKRVPFVIIENQIIIPREFVNKIKNPNESNQHLKKTDQIGLISPYFVIKDIRFIRLLQFQISLFLQLSGIYEDTYPFPILFPYTYVQWDSLICDIV